MSFPGLYLSTQGRINRGKWWLGIVCASLAAVVLYWIMIRTLDFDRMLYTFSGRLTVFVVNIATIAALYSVNAKRFQDRNKPKTYALIAFGIGGFKAVLDLLGITGDWFGPNMGDTVFQVILTIIGIWYLVELGFLRGTAGPNDYGPDPLQRP
jgi:uncharacterized membrane protein YhaH (DUF805 family)